MKTVQYRMKNESTHSFLSWMPFSSLWEPLLTIWFLSFRFFSMYLYIDIRHTCMYLKKGKRIQLFILFCGLFFLLTVCLRHLSAWVYLALLLSSLWLHYSTFVITVFIVMAIGLNPNEQGSVYILVLMAWCGLSICVSWGQK